MSINNISLPHRLMVLVTSRLPKKLQYEISNHIPPPQAERCDLTNHLNTALAKENTRRGWEDALLVSGAVSGSIVGAIIGLPSLLLGGAYYQKKRANVEQAIRNAHRNLSHTHGNYSITDNQFDNYVGTYSKASAALKNSKNLQIRERFKVAIDTVNRKLQDGDIDINEAGRRIRDLTEFLELKEIPDYPPHYEFKTREVTSEAQINRGFIASEDSPINWAIQTADRWELLEEKGRTVTHMNKDEIIANIQSINAGINLMNKLEIDSEEKTRLEGVLGRMKIQRDLRP